MERLKSIIWGNLFTKRNQRTVYDVLRSVALFDTLSRSQLKKIERIGHIRYFDKDEVVFYKGEPSYGMYVVLDGDIAVCIGKSKLQKYTKGDFFGEFAIVKDSVRTATASSVQKSILFYLNETDLKQLFSEDPKLGFDVYEKIINMLVEMLTKFDEELLQRNSKKLSHWEKNSKKEN